MKNPDTRSQTAVYLRFFREAYGQKIGHFVVGAGAALLIALFVTAGSAVFVARKKIVTSDETPIGNSTASDTWSADRSPAGLPGSQERASVPRIDGFRETGSSSSADANRGKLHDVSNSNLESSQQYRGGVISGQNVGYGGSFSVSTGAASNSRLFGGTGASETASGPDYAPGRGGGFSQPSSTSSGFSTVSGGGISVSGGGANSTSDDGGTGSENLFSQPPGTILLSDGGWASSPSMQAQISVNSPISATVASGSTILLITALGGGGF